MVGRSHNFIGNRLVPAVCGLGLLFAPTAAVGQQGCSMVAEWSSCDLAFELTPQDNSAQMTLSGEFRSPRHRTYLLNAFREGSRMIFRFAPSEAGVWEYKLTSNVARWNDQEGQLAAAAAPEAPGFVQVRNVHHFATEGNAKQHLWMAAALDRFTEIPRPEFDKAVSDRADGKYTHLRVTLAPNTNLNEAVERIRAINVKGLVVDLVLAAIPLEAQARQQYLTDIVARFAALNITWSSGAGFEEIPHGRSVLKDAGTLLKRLDAYQHPRTAMASVTSAPLLGDAWMNIRSYGTTDANVGAVEHQLYQVPAINTGIQSQKDLWNATMNGQYPASGNGPYMKAWSAILSASRYWELEPYFDVDGGRAIALDGTEYLIYIEKPALVELTVEKHGYDVAWFNPATGEMTKAKEYNGEHFTGEPPDKSHDWVLRLSREGRKEGMLGSYKFESRRVPVQEVETDPQRVPFEVAAPVADEISLSNPPKFSLKTKRETRATRSLLVEWTAEVVLDGEGYRLAGSGREGTLRIPTSVANKLPGVVLMRVAILNANGKAYTADKVYRLTQ
ncbi:MAG: putative collagen-binding domain-containing protein [Bryobacteraceae bacterium]